MKSNALADFQSQLQSRVAQDAGTGIIVGIIDHDRVTVYKAGTDGKGRPVDEHTLFEIGSVTKTFTATILARMVLEQRVRLSDPVAKYLPKDVHVPSKDGKQITLLELAEQRSGLPRLPTNMDQVASPDPYADYGSHELYSFLNSYSLKRDPGSEWEYSNLGFGLLGQALANRSGMGYEAMLQAQIVRPLGMSDTAVTLSPEQQRHFAVGHNGAGDPVHPWSFKALAGAGAIRSSLADMLKYLRCNMGEGPLAHVCLFAQQPRADMPNGRIGLAWWTTGRLHIVNHGGDTAGYHTMVAISADHQRGVVVLSNGGEPVDRVGLHALDPADIPLTYYEDARIAPERLDEYTGFFEMRDSPGVGFAVKRENDKLLVQITGQEFARVFPVAKKDEFFYHVVAAHIDFQRDASGKVVALTLFQNGRAIVAIKSGVDPDSVKFASAAFPPVVPLDESTLSSYVGSYVGNAGMTFTVTRVGNQLMVQLGGQPSYPVYASAKDQFYYKIVDAQISFKRDGSGKVQSLVLHQNGMEVPAMKQ